MPSIFTDADERRFADRDQILTDLAVVRGPYRNPPLKRTWQDWEEIRRQVDDVGRFPEQDAALRRAFILAPTLEVCEAILRGQRVPRSKLSADGLKAFGL